MPADRDPEPGEYRFSEFEPLIRQRVKTKWPFYKRRYLGDQEDLVQAGLCGLWQWMKRKGYDELDRVDSEQAAKAVRRALFWEVKLNPRNKQLKVFVSDVDGREVTLADLLPARDSFADETTAHLHAVLSNLWRPGRDNHLCIGPESFKRYLVWSLRDGLSFEQIADRTNYTAEYIRRCFGQIRSSLKLALPTRPEAAELLALLPSD